MQINMQIITIWDVLLSNVQKGHFWSQLVAGCEEGRGLWVTHEEVGAMDRNLACTGRLFQSATVTQLFSFQHILNSVLQRRQTEWEEVRQFMMVSGQSVEWARKANTLFLISSPLVTPGPPPFRSRLDRCTEGHHTWPVEPRCEE